MPGSHQADESGSQGKNVERDKEAVSRELLTFFSMYLIFYENALSYYLYNC